MNNLQQRMTHDLAVLKAAFSLLPEEFPDGKWKHKIVDFQSIHQVPGGSIEFEFVIQETWITTLGTEVMIQVPVLSIIYLSTRKKHPYHIKTCREGVDVSFPTIYAAVEFIGRVSRGLTPIDSSAAALEARFGGAS